MNSEKLERSNNTHIELKKKAYNIMYDSEINVVYVLSLRSFLSLIHV